MELEMPVFVDTSLGTRLALSAPGSITARDLKRKLKCEHILCFPTLGEIIVHSLMVKQKTNLYHIPDSMFIREACCGSRSAWFLQMNASLLTDITLQQIESPPSINHRRQKISHQGESVCPNSKIMSASSNDPNNISTCCKVSDQSLRSEVQGFSTLNDRKSPNVTKIVKLGENIQVNAVAKEAVDTSKTCKSVNSDVDSAKKVFQRGETWLSEHPSKGGEKMNSSPIKEVPSANCSEEISVSGLILRYFCDNDEVNASKIWQKLGRQTVSDVYDSNCIEETSFAMKHGQYSAEERASNEIPACSVNSSASETKFSSSRGCKTAIIVKHDPTFDDDEISHGVIANVKKTNRCCIRQAENSLSGANKHQRLSRRRVNRKLAPLTPQSISKIRRSPFNKHSITFNCNRYEVGKHLVLAAKRISPSVGAQISPMFHSISRCGNVCALNSTLIPKRCVFEISDSDH
ncbi:uncharacterized protein LOC122037107 isoform X2 [Zingiber officinale]|uniref:Uncharacterized protein n=1 Tax=Zingiber officinale TaxID=94328 RepID=A0A8J5EST7_ZINOF|nr:uncharacterized protein LOC122037107 isoform X2 [Zingiber officinale]KAG6467112.1 hypothetical protein ZIOFF_075085 [Zingiber officinale]